MTVITLVGATPFASSHLIPTSIGAFVGGQNTIGSIGSLEDKPEIYAINYLYLLVLSAIVGLVWSFIVTSPKLKLLDGYAGRLGTTTFIGMQITMLTVYCPTGVVDWNRYYYGFVHTIHIGEEDSAFDLKDAWIWVEEVELMIGYIVSVIWLGVYVGSVRILHDRYVQRCKQIESSSATEMKVPAPLNNVLVPCLLALLSILLVNATNYKHAPGLYNGFAGNCKESFPGLFQ